jgi:hypothetical protein
MVAWPSTLPQSPLLENWQETPPNLIIRTSMEVGVPKVRRRATTGPRAMTWPLLLTSAQVDILETFFYTTILAGSVIFTHKHPRTGAATNNRIKGPPVYTRIAQYYRCDLDWEIIP